MRHCFSIERYCLYGCGLRLMECLRLRVKDLDFKQRQITVSDGKGGKERVTMLPERLSEPLRIWEKPRRSTRGILRRASVWCTCRSLWNRSTRMRIGWGLAIRFPRVAPFG
jgi:integrase